MDIKQKVALDAADQQRVAALNDATMGVQRMMDSFMSMGERRMAELQAQARTLWTDLGQKYGLDLQHVQYVPSEDGTALVAKAVQL